MERKILFLCVILVGLLVLAAEQLVNASSLGGAEVRGMVIDETGAVAGARVRIRATENLVLSEEDGRFVLSGLEEGTEIEITAWADGHYTAAELVTPPADGVTLILRPYHTQDHASYVWVDPLAGDSACAACHPSIISQWSANAHGQAVDNGRFFSLYNGTNVSGEIKIGPGFANDFPGEAGNCAACHAPGAAVDAPLSTDMNAVRDQVTAGIHCDFCHKVGGVDLDEQSGSVFDNRPGVQSLRMLRPPQGDDIFFGPFDDVHDPDTYLPLTSESAYCAACHQFSFHGTPVYESYNEWLASPYAAIDVTCQDCHMPPTGESFFAPPEVGGVERRPPTIPSHLQPGAGRNELGDYSGLSMIFEQQGQRLWVQVRVHNFGAGHHYPTDYPGRQLLLTVEAVDALGRPLVLESGPHIPAWGGDLAGRTGTGYAKILADTQTGEAPVVSYWKPTRIVSDNRIPALSSATSTYAFILPSGTGEVEVTADLVYRFQFAGLMAQKEWDKPDILSRSLSRGVSYTPEWVVFTPFVGAVREPPRRQ
jgi:hypothetical protein